jgi:hypothetical protein
MAALFLLGTMSLPCIAASGNDCGSNEFRTEITAREALTTRALPVEPTVGEFPTDHGTPECLRVEFRLTPSGQPWSVRTPASSGNFAFNLAAMRAFASYRFSGSWWGVLTKRVVILSGIDNQKPRDWDQPTRAPDRP